MDESPHDFFMMMDILTMLTSFMLTENAGKIESSFYEDIQFEVSSFYGWFVQHQNVHEDLSDS